MFQMGRNATWLANDAWDVVSASAEFFASRASVDRATGNFTQLSVISPDERAGLHDSNAYTNAVAGETMRFALRIANLTGRQHQGLANWTRISRAVYLPTASLGDMTVHPEYAGYNGEAINQADVALIYYPLGLAMSRALTLADLTYYQQRSSGPGTAGFYTGDSAYSIAWLALGVRVQADIQFGLAFAHMDLGAYNVWCEKSFGDFGHKNFVTGAGGYLQNYIMGYGGVRYTDEGTL